MQRTDQVVGEAREKLALEQKKLADALSYFRPHWATNGPVMLTPDKMRQHLAVIEGALRDMATAALRAQPERGAEEMRPAIHAWIREDVPLAGKMNLFPEHVDALIAKLRALSLHPAKDEGGATDA